MQAGRLAMGNAIDPTLIMRTYSLVILVLISVVATETDSSEIVNPHSILEPPNDGGIDKYEYFKEIENQINGGDEDGPIYDIALAPVDPEAVETGSESLNKRGHIDRYGFYGRLGKRRMDRYSFFSKLGKRSDNGAEDQLHLNGLNDIGQSEMLDDGTAEIDAEKRRMDNYAFLGRLGKRYSMPMGFRGTLGKRLPLGFRGQLGKRYMTPMSFHGQLGKRMSTPYGFIGQLGKRMRTPMGFIGQLGRRKRSANQRIIQIPMRLMRGIDRYSFAARLGKRVPRYRYLSQLGKRENGEEDILLKFENHRQTLDPDETARRYEPAQLDLHCWQTHDLYRDSLYPYEQA